MVKEEREMKIFRLFIVISFYIFALSLQASYAQEVKIPTFTVDYKPAGENGERFNKEYGQCVDFVKQSRSDLFGIGAVGTAANMPNVAKEKGFEVNNLPREGSAIVMPDVKIIKTGEITGHVGIVTNVKETNDGIYTLTIRDANAKNDIKYDKNDKIIQGSSVIERTVTYDMKEKKVIDGILKEQSNIMFIHEKKDVYNVKQEEASQYATQIFKNLLGREPNDKEKKGYSEKLITGIISPQQLQSDIKKSPEYQQRINELRKEIVETNKPSLKDKIKDKTEQVKEKAKEKIEQIKESIKEKVNQLKAAIKEKAASSASINVIPKTILPIAKIDAVKIIEMPKTLPMNLPQGNISDSSKLRETTGQEKLTPVKIEFTQTYDGLFTQSADSLGSRYGSHSGTLTDGTRVNVIGDSRAGDFTGSFSGRTVAEPGYTPATHNNSPFSGSSVGKVSAIGFKEGDLKGTMTVTVPAGTQTVNVTGNITIKTDGSLSMPSYSGPVTTNDTGAKVGTMSGSWSQNKTR